MSESIAADVRTMFKDHASFTGWTFLVGATNTNMDKTIALSDTGGLPANPKFLLDYPTLQAFIRGVAGDYLGAKAAANAIKDLLLGIDSQTVDNVRWVSVTLLSDVQWLGVDNNQRPQFSVNFNWIIEPPTNANTNRVPL